jgi:hypothetical protein
MPDGCCQTRVQVLQEKLDELPLRVNGVVLKYDERSQESPSNNETNHQPRMYLPVRPATERRSKVAIHSVLLPAIQSGNLINAASPPTKASPLCR